MSSGHVILISSYYLLPIKFPTKLSTELPIKSLQTPRCYHSHLSCTNLDTTYSCTNLDTTFYIAALAISGAKVLRVLQSQAGLQEKTPYRLAFF